MHKLLIPLIFCFTATIANAQVPTLIKRGTAKPNAQPSPEGACSAGTFTFGPILGESNDNTPDTLFLCQGDSMCVTHNGDAMFMDPDPSTPAGIAYAFYKYLPTKDGDEMAVLSDTSLWPGASNGFFATQGPANGNHCFFNNGSITMSSIFGQNNPVAVTFAPMTITDYANGLLEPGCVDVGINEAFTIVYLKPIEIISINTNFTDDCKGKFRLQGGYPEWDKNETYTVSIFLSTDPSVRALIYTPPFQIKDGLDVIFSVPQPGVYTIVVEDGKSCGVTVQINMNGCTPGNNVTIAMPELTVPPDSSICVPVTVTNFQNILGSSFSIVWDPTVLRYDSITNPNPAIGGNMFGAANGNLNENEAINGFLGMVYSDFAGTTNVPNDSVLFEVCFTAIAPLDSCTTLDVGSFPTTVTMDDAFGGELAVTVDTGSVCVDFFPLVIQSFINKLNCDNTAQLGVNITGGQGPYEVIWRTCPGVIGGISVSNIATTILTLPVAEGCWEICVTDLNGLGTQICQTLNVIIPSLGATMAVVQLPTCNGASNGSVRADVTIDGVLIPNPGPNFTYAWNTMPVQIMQTISGLPQGNYRVTVTDLSTGCTQVAAGSLSQPPAITVNPTITPATCPGIADGSITLTAAGGTPGPAGSQYLFQWEYSPDCQPNNFSPDDNGAGNPFVATGKAAGCYCVTVTDANGCTLIDCVEITNARDVRIDTILVSDPSCFGLSDGSIQAQILANPAFVNPNFLFFWNPVLPPPATP
ncbi:MAG: cohesin domain-containing protein, partial [Saprospiraceae bacterium]